MGLSVSVSVSGVIVWLLCSWSPVMSCWTSLAWLLRKQSQARKDVFDGGGDGKGDELTGLHATRRAEGALRGSFSSRVGIRVSSVHPSDLLPSHQIV